MVLGKGGISHGREMRSSEEGAVLLTGGNGMLFVCWVAGIDIGNDGGSGMLTGSGVSSIGSSGLYCSIDEYSCQCDPQGTRGSGGNATWGGPASGGLGGMGNGMNGEGSTSGAINAGVTGGSGTMIGADDGGSGMMMVDPPLSPKEVGLGMNMGDLLLNVLLQFLRSVWSSLRNV